MLKYISRIYRDNQMMKKAILFDMDGVLVETEHLKAEAHARAVARFGGQAQQDLYARVMGQPHTAVRAAFIGAAGMEIDPAAYSSAYLEIYHHLLDTRLRLTPGVTALLAGLQARQLTLALVTSSQAGTTEKILRQAGLAGFFPVRIVAEDVRRGKPDPEPYQTALDRLALRSKAALALEDSQVGVAAAAAAGLPVIALRHRFNSGHDFSKAVQTLDSLSDTAGIIDLIELILSDRLEGA
jgi:HAD superfamily hydrolase (TIGR01509 family)